MSHLQNPWLLFFIGVTALHQITDATWCYVCDNTGDGTTCLSIIKCPDHQMCYLQKYITSKGQTSYRSGCQNKTICNSYSKRKAAIGLDPVVCEACCDKDRCNARLCGGKSTTFPTTVCYACPATSDPTQCKAAMHCQRDGKCLEYSYHVPQTNQLMYYQGCSSKQRCEALAQVAATSHAHQSGFLFQHVAWYNTTCCDRYMCNDGRAVMAAAATTPST
ncbi:uncharacterized protein LOC124121933 [Haliotis rufescens]|uniref:uncharacterized protein LOC124121933 n=1 Tax=Haliotis rufescens TaxID=6454 RepID=UPI00201F7701|nr:uncharacterized protein LOC124121933 [Haliotis rufescens]